MKTLQQRIKAACDYDETTQFRYAYGGRGMYGDKCIAIVGVHMDCKDVIVTVINTMLEDIGCGGCTIDVVQAAVPVLLNFNEDSMGRRVVFYWKELSTV